VRRRLRTAGEFLFFYFHYFFCVFSLCLLCVIAPIITAEGTRRASAPAHCGKRYLSSFGVSFVRFVIMSFVCHCTPSLLQRARAVRRRLRLRTAGE
jgi:hypothetical protein